MLYVYFERCKIPGGICQHASQDEGELVSSILYPISSSTWRRVEVHLGFSTDYWNQCGGGGGGGGKTHAA